MNFKEITRKLYLIGLSGIFTICSCSKERTESHQSINDLNSTAFVYYEQNELETKLNKLWKNYATFNGIVLNNGQVANLNETISASEAATLLHYGLNLAIVNPRIGYANELADSFECNLTLNAAGNITYDALCNTLQTIANHLKQVRQGIANENKALNRLEIIMPQEGAGTTISVKAKYLFSFGPVWSVDELTNEANHTPIGIQFNAPTPWISQQSFEGIENPNNQNIQTVPRELDLYFYVFNNRTSTTLAERRNAFNNNLPNEKAVHHYLTSNAVYWPNPVAQLSGWSPNSTSTVPVMTPPNQLVNPNLNFIYTVDGLNGTNVPYIPSVGDVRSTDIPMIDCSNPQTPPIGTQLGINDLQPSMILSYNLKEYDASLTTIRRINQTTMNYFWSKRPQIATHAWGLNNAEILQRMQYIPNGYYAVTSYRTIPFKGAGNPTGVCSFGILCGDGSICNYGFEYYVETTYNHFLNLPATPAQLGILF